MKKILLNKFSLMALLLMAVFQTVMTSCSDDKEGMGTPVITAVRVTDPAKADSTFTKATAGQMLAIIGENLSDVRKVFINDQEVQFNSTMNTSRSLIVTVPTEEKGFILTAFDSSLKDEIRVETSHGTAVYAFKILAPSPSLTRLYAVYPRKAGDSLYIYGINLVDIEKIYFTDIKAEALDTTVWETVGGKHVEVAKFKNIQQDHHINEMTQAYETSSVVGIELPSISYDEGSLVVETKAGVSYLPFTKLPGKPIIKSINTDMPVFGEAVVISGNEFVQVEAIKYGNVTLSSSDFTVSEGMDEIQLVFKKKPSVGGDGMLTVVTPGGSAAVPFYNYNCLLTDFEEETAIDNGWDPKAVIDETDGDDVPYVSDGYFARFNIPSEGQQWWGTMIYFRKDWDGNKFPLPGYDVIPADASTDDVYLAMEVYNNNSDYNNGKFTGYLRYFLQYDNEDPVTPNDDSGNPNPADKVNVYDNGFTWTDYNAQACSFDRPILADINNKTPQREWYRHVIPLSSFMKYKGKDYKFVYENGINQFRIQSMNQGTRKGKIDVCFDNIRIFYNKK